MPSFSIALSGLQADSVALNTIGNNLANLNTTAYKKHSTAFEDLFYQQIGTSGSGDAKQVGVGTKVSSTSTNYLQGSLSSTGNSTDMALSGNGFFVVSQDGVQSMTRAGNFQLDQSGNLTTVDGAQVMGYAAVNGVTQGGGVLSSLSIPIGVNEPAQATSKFAITAKLNAASAIGTSFTTPIAMYDSLGKSHAASVTYTKASTNSWSYAVTLPAGDATGTPANNMGTLTFDGSGKLTSPAASVAGITFPGMADGASELAVQWNLYDAAGNGTLTQSTAASSATASKQDGFASGVYQSFTVDTTGVITAAFSNGHTEAIGQLAIATVTNLQGLTSAGNNNFVATAVSGAPSLGVAGAGGRGIVEDATLEQSNVDISTEFSELIVAQRSFEANSKTVTTFDTITQDTIAMIR